MSQRHPLIGRRVSVYQDSDRPVEVGQEPVAVVAVCGNLICVWDTEVVPAGRFLWFSTDRVQGLEDEGPSPDPLSWDGLTPEAATTRQGPSAAPWPSKPPPGRRGRPVARRPHVPPSSQRFHMDRIDFTPRGMKCMTPM